MSSVELKICGLVRNCDARLADRLGAGYIGAVLAEHSPRRIAPEQLAELFAGCRNAMRVGVFVNQSLDFIRRSVELGGLEVVQLHGCESPEFAASIDFAEVWAANRSDDFPAAALLADGASGGSGLCCDWSAAARLARKRKLVLAGGLNAGNLAAAWRAVRPFALDVNSGVESSPGVKDERRMIGIFEALKNIELEER
ncbi:MAG: phosphoribosylanthranilate isomerase [Victivallaceae bacterium]|nr:phosphoribosylanthranilate isomerase [Victivallaceae bacterium]